MSRATAIGEGIGLDVEGSRVRYAAARARYRAAITEALDRLCIEYDDGDGWLTREPVPYAAAGMTYPFERREIDGRGETQDHARATSDRTDRSVVRGV